MVKRIVKCSWTKIYILKSQVWSVNIKELSNYKILENSKYNICHIMPPFYKKKINLEFADSEYKFWNVC